MCQVRAYFLSKLIKCIDEITKIQYNKNIARRWENVVEKTIDLVTAVINLAAALLLYEASKKNK